MNSASSGRLLLVAMLAFAACSGGGGGGGGKGKIEIWSSLPRQGSSKAQTDTIVNAIKMAFEEAGGKVGGYTINVHRQGRLDRRRRQVGRGDRDQERQRCGRERQARRLHRHVQLGRGQAVDPDPVREGHRHGQPGQHLPRPDQAVRAGRAGQVLPERLQAELHARRPGRRPAGQRRRALGSAARRQERLRPRRHRGLRQGHRRRLRLEGRRVRPDRPRPRRHRRQGDRLQGAGREDQGRPTPTSSTTAASPRTTPASCGATCATRCRTSS